MNTNPYFQSDRFKRDLCQLNFDVNGNNSIELLMPDRLWQVVDKNTGLIESLDIEDIPIGLSVNFVDGDKYNPYTLALKLESTNLTDTNFSRSDLERISQRKHRLKIYTEKGNQAVAEFENVKALRFDFKLKRMHIDEAVLKSN